MDDRRLCPAVFRRSFSVFQALLQGCNLWKLSRYQQHPSEYGFYISFASLPSQPCGCSPEHWGCSGTPNAPDLCGDQRTNDKVCSREGMPLDELQCKYLSSRERLHTLEPISGTNLVLLSEDLHETQGPRTREGTSSTSSGKTRGCLGHTISYSGAYCGAVAGV